MDKIFTLVNDAPNNEKDKNDLIFFKRINTWISKNASNLDNLILCGDFNCQLDVNKNDKSAGT